MQLPPGECCGAGAEAACHLARSAASPSSDLELGEPSSQPLICTPHASTLRAYTSCGCWPLRRVPKSLNAPMNCLTLPIDSSKNLRK
jgi:hypothetical protein